VIVVKLDELLFIILEDIVFEIAALGDPGEHPTTPGFDDFAQFFLFEGRCSNEFYFDNFEFFVENDKGKFQKANLKNADFEKPFAGHLVPEWAEGTGSSSPVKVIGYSLSLTDERVHGKHALLIERKDVQVLIYIFNLLA